MVAVALCRASDQGASLLRQRLVEDRPAPVNVGIYGVMEVRHGNTRIRLMQAFEKFQARWYIGFDSTLVLTVKFGKPQRCHRPKINIGFKVLESADGS